MSVTLLSLEFPNPLVSRTAVRLGEGPTNNDDNERRADRGSLHFQFLRRPFGRCGAASDVGRDARARADPAGPPPGSGPRLVSTIIRNCGDVSALPTSLFPGFGGADAPWPAGATGGRRTNIAAGISTTQAMMPIQNIAARQP